MTRRTLKGLVHVPVPYARINLIRNKKHIERHLYEHASRGSKFLPGMAFENIVGTVLQCMIWAAAGVPKKDLRVEKDGHVKVQIRTPFLLGACGVVSFDEIPKGRRVRRELRGKGEDAYEVNVVRMTAPLEDRLVMDFFRDKKGWYLFTCYPGFLTPPSQDTAFWSRHAFLTETRISIAEQRRLKIGKFRNPKTLRFGV